MTGLPPDRGSGCEGVGISRDTYTVPYLGVQHHRFSESPQSSVF